MNVTSTLFYVAVDWVTEWWLDRRSDIYRWKQRRNRKRFR